MLQILCFRCRVNVLLLYLASLMLYTLRSTMWHKLLSSSSLSVSVVQARHSMLHAAVLRRTSYLEECLYSPMSPSLLAGSTIIQTTTVVRVTLLSALLSMASPPSTCMVSLPSRHMGSPVCHMRLAHLLVRITVVRLSQAHTVLISLLLSPMVQHPTSLLFRCLVRLVSPLVLPS